MLFKEKTVSFEKKMAILGQKLTFLVYRFFLFTKVVIRIVVPQREIFTIMVTFHALSTCHLKNVEKVVQQGQKFEFLVKIDFFDQIRHICFLFNMKSLLPQREIFTIWVTFHALSSEDLKTREKLCNTVKS